MAIQKFGNPADSGYLDGIVGQSKEFYEKYDFESKNKDKPQFTESELYLMDMNSRLKKGERVKAEDSQNQIHEESGNDSNAQQNSNLEQGKFKSFDANRDQDSHFSGQFNPIFEQNNEQEASSQNESQNKPKTNNIFNRTESLFRNTPNSLLKENGSSPSEGKKIGFKDDMNDLLKPKVEVEDGENLNEEDQNAIEEKRVNETIMTEYVDESEVKDKHSMNQGNKATGEVGNVLLSSINQSRDGEWK